MNKKQLLELRNQIEKDLLDQLERNGTVGEHYKDLVGDYMSLWDTKNLLAADIKKNEARSLIMNQTPAKVSFFMGKTNE